MRAWHVRGIRYGEGGGGGGEEEERGKETGGGLGQLGRLGRFGRLGERGTIGEGEAILEERRQRGARLTVYLSVGGQCSAATVESVGMRARPGAGRLCRGLASVFEARGCVRMRWSAIAGEPSDVSQCTSD